MEIQARGQLCRGKVGKQGVKYLFKSDATAEKCQAACLDDPQCKFMTLKTKGKKTSKWQCISFKSCKKKAKKDFAVYKKVKADEAGSPKSTDDARVRSSDEDVSKSEQKGKKGKKKKEKKKKKEALLLRILDHRG
jgi:hypothetical protein